MSIFQLCKITHCRQPKPKHDCVKNSAPHKKDFHLHKVISEIKIEKEMESDEAKKTNLKAAKLAFQKLKTEWNKRPPNLEVCGQLLVELKVINK